ncbi:Fc.00g099120.m01.CDS01 [Cosmosporella sp. VM-42]
MANAPPTLVPDPIYCHSYDPENDFRTLNHCFTALQKHCRAACTEEGLDALDSQRYEACARFIYGSNTIEGVCISLVVTNWICRKASNFPKSTTQAEADNMVDLIRRVEPNWTYTDEFILRGFRDVTNHVEAFIYVLDQLRAKDITKGVLQNAYMMLCRKIPNLKGKFLLGDFPEFPVETYEDMTESVAVVELCTNLTEELAEKLKTGRIDPISIAVKYSMQLADIYPFLVGVNRKMCRILLNAVLCLFLPIPVAIGVTEKDAVEFLRIKRRATEQADYGEYARFILEKTAANWKQTGTEAETGTGVETREDGPSSLSALFEDAVFFEEMVYRHALNVRDNNLKVKIYDTRPIIVWPPTKEEHVDHDAPTVPTRVEPAGHDSQAGKGEKPGDIKTDDASNSVFDNQRTIAKEQNERNSKIKKSRPNQHTRMRMKRRQEEKKEEEEKQVAKKEEKVEEEEEEEEDLYSAN